MSRTFPCLQGEDGKVFTWLSYLNELGSWTGKPWVHEVLFSEALAQRSQETVDVLMDGDEAMVR